MEIETYFRDHWVTIEPDRFAAYDQLFAQPDAVLDAMLAPLGLAPGQVALDFGCGPGYVAAGMARHVGPDGHVHGVDLNADFIARSRDVAEQACIQDRCTFHHVVEDRLPLPDASVDRALAKNVLEYVPDLAGTLAELRRVLRPGGRLVALDSDWGFLVAEPWESDEVREVLSAAAPAFREPNIGRKLRAALRTAGFADVQVQVPTMVDLQGRGRSVLENMLGYGVRFGRLAESRATELRARLDAALADGSYLFVLPQFVVAGTVS